MKTCTTRTITGTAAAATIAVISAVTTATAGSAAGPDGVALTGLASANERYDGYAPASRYDGSLEQVAVAQGSTLVENPSDAVSTYGYDNDVTVAGQPQRPQMVPTPTNPATEAHKSEPDKNTYLVFPNGLPGADPSYDYGTHFLFQGHEGGSPGMLTRINLDADAVHRVTVLATKDSTGADLANIDGSSWEPWSQRLLLTTESSSKPTYAATPGYPSTVTDVSGALGRGGYEGIQDDGDGNIWIVEDIGGSAKTDNGTPTKAKRPNSYVYRYVPTSPGDLANGKLQALQVLAGDGHPITFSSQAGLDNADQSALYGYGNAFRTQWVTIHDTATDGSASFAAGPLAAAADATPFKRPENGAFRPESGFTEFYFTVTGDTDATSPENAHAGGWGGVMKLTQSSPSAATGRLTMFYKGDEAHTGLDNIAFLGRDQLAAVEDAGDTLHGQRNALDSGFAWDVTADYSKPGVTPVRWLAEGRDASATIDASSAGFGKNDGDNEVTGLYVSDGDSTVGGVLGTHKPQLATDGGSWRWFYTQQHGDNITYEVSTTKSR